MPRRLEYTFGLWTCRLGTEFEVGINPFTGAEVRIYTDEGLSGAERKATLALLSDQGAELEDAGGFYHKTFGGDVEVSVGLGTLADDTIPVIGAEVNIVGRRLTDDVLRFVYDLACTANMALTPSVAGDGPEAVTREPIDPVLRERWPAVVVVRIPAGLTRWLETYVVPRDVI
jgi:hypothetical protein